MNILNIEPLVKEVKKENADLDKKSNYDVVDTTKVTLAEKISEDMFKNIDKYRVNNE